MSTTTHRHGRAGAAALETAPAGAGVEQATAKDLVDTRAFTVRPPPRRIHGEVAERPGRR
ncbi:hypothetical protein AAFM48_12485 [Burkholderia pseudomallei]